MMKTQQQDAIKGLQEAALNAAFAVDADATKTEPKREESGQKPWNPRDGKKPVAVSPLNGVPTPPGKPKGVKNRLTNLRDAVLEAFDQVGGAQYLARLAEGTQSDRAAFVSLVSKVLPTQINANVEGGIQVQLSWLGQRSIGTTTAQQAEQVTQVVDLERDSSGKYRIKDQQHTLDAGGPAAAEGQEGAKGG